MSEPTKDLKVTERVVQGPGPGRGPFGGGMVGQKASNFSDSARRLMLSMAPERLKLTVVVVLAIASVGFAVAGPILLGRATDIILAGLFGRSISSDTTLADYAASLRASGDERLADLVASLDHVVPGQGVDFGALGSVLLIVVGVYVASSLASWLQAYLLNDIVQGVVYRMREDVEHKLNRLPLRFFDRQPRGELLSRVTNDIDNVSQTLTQTMSQLLVSLLTVIGVLGAMVWISPLLALVAVIAVPLTILVSGRVMKRSQSLFIQQWRRTGALNAHVEESFTGHSLVKVFGRQDEVARTFDEQNDELFEVSFGAQFVSGLIMPLMMFIGNIQYVAIAVIGAVRVSSGSMSLGDVQAFIQYSRQFTQPLTQVASMVNLLQSGVASAERVFELLDADEEDAGPEGPPPTGVGRIAFEGVSFAYAADRPLIEDLSLVVEPGQTVAIVGPTGAGKTTLVNLVMRFYDLDEGRITLDGVDITAMSRRSLRSRVGMVLQDAWLFEGTIRDNIAYGRLGASEDEILAAARATFVDRFVHSLPDGYDTIIDEAGANISAGERQLITIARAFLSEPALLILDEATSSVDTRTELLIQEAMGRLRADRTSFVIAHRLSTIRDADVILMMEDGRIVEQGSHDVLMARGGAYAALYASQFAAPTV